MLRYSTAGHLELVVAVFFVPLIFFYAHSSSNGAVLAMDTENMMTGGGHSEDHAMFHPLSCNSMLDMLTSPEDCTALSALLGADGGSHTEVRVPCGECAVVDYATLLPLVLGGATNSSSDNDGAVAVLDLRGGINVEGMLHFPPPPLGAPSFQIRTPYIIVQGELRIDAPSPDVIPANGPSTAGGRSPAPLEFVLHGTEEVSFAPHPDNAMACMHDGGAVDGTAAECKVGKKAIVVAGGRLNVQAMPLVAEEECPSWTRLADVRGAAPTVIAPLDLDQAPVPPTGSCPAVVVHEDFADDFSSDGSSVAGGVGWDGFSAPFAGVEVDEVDSSISYYAVKTRTSSYHGPRVSLPVNCLQADMPYLLSYRYRVRSTTGSPSLASTEGGDWLPWLKMIRKDAGTGGNDWISPTMVDGRGQMGTIPDDKWKDVANTIMFTSQQADASQTSELYLYLMSLDMDVEIHLDSFRLALPPSSLYGMDGTQVCSSLIRNGNANATDGHIYPFYVSGGYLQVISDDDGPSTARGSSYFRSTTRTSRWSSVLSQDLQYSGCASPGQVYEFSTSYRVHSNSFSDPRSVAVALNVEGDGDMAIAECPPSTGEWVQCTCRFTITEDQVASNLSINIHLTGDDYTPAVDFSGVKVDFVAERSAIDTLFVEDAASVTSCWGPGAEILITSHTIRYTDDQVVNIASVDSILGKITLDRPIYRPITVADDSNTAVEVALLSRNVKFSAEDDDAVNPLHGGHVIVLHTPHVGQRLSGVEVDGFGQQGNMGRYPIHFHMSNSAMGSLVSSNTIRNSKQRCLVLHNTDDVHVKSNVAYNTVGHCFVLEDGSEQNNILENNLGAGQSPVEVKISDDESDNLPATFWLLNPQNTFVGNVAAGSSHSGFWFEVKATVRGKSHDLHPEMYPNKLPLKEFRDNISHSNGFKGLHTYPQTGYRPAATAIFQNHKSYRNGGDGVFFHAGGRLQIDGGYFADNRVAVEIDMDHSDKITNAVIIGRSKAYQDVIDAFGEAAYNYPYLTHCKRVGGDGLLGIIIDTYHWGGPDATGTIIDNISFSGFSDNVCPGSVSSALTTGHHNTEFFDPRNSVSIIVFEDDSNKITLCKSAENGIENIAMRDIDGSLSGTGVPGFYVSDNVRMAADPRCTSVSGTCAAHCPNVCLRKVAIFVSSYAPYDLIIEVNGMNEVGVILPTTTFSKLVSYKESDETDWDSFHKIYVSLPSGGSYTARFATESNPNETLWPTFADVRYEDYPNECGPDFAQFNIEQPKNTCTSLIKNGDMGDSTGGSIEGWWHIQGGLEVASGGADASAFSLTNTNRVGSWDGLAQYIDTRCMIEGKAYAFRAKVKLLKDGYQWQCNPSAYSNLPDSCPSATLRSSYGVNRNSDWMPIGSTVTGDQEWNKMEGIFIVNAFTADAGFAAIYITGAPAGVDIILDSVSLVLMTPAPTFTPTTTPSNSPTFSKNQTLANAPVLFSTNSEYTESTSFAADGHITFASSSGKEAVVITKDAHAGDIDFIIEIKHREIFGTGYQSGIYLFFAPEENTIHHMETSDNQFSAFEGNAVALLGERIYPSIQSATWMTWKAQTTDGTVAQYPSLNYQMLQGFLRLYRTNGMVHAYHSQDGTTWSEIGTLDTLPDEYKTAPLKIGARMKRNWMSQYSMNFLPTIISDGPVSAIPETVPETSPPAFESSDFDYLNTVTFGGDGISLAASSGQEAAVMSSRAHNGVGSEADLEILVELTSREIFGGGYQAGLALFFASADATIEDVSSSNYGNFESNVVSTIKEKIYPPSTGSTWFDFKSTDTSDMLYKPPSQWSANYQMLSGYLKLERKNGFITASHSHHGALWTMIGSSVELPVALKTAPLKIGMRISRNWNVEYSLTVKPIITSGGAA